VLPQLQPLEERVVLEGGAFFAAKGQAFQGLVANFSGPAADSYNATILWGWQRFFGGANQRQRQRQLRGERHAQLSRRGAVPGRRGDR